MTDPYEEDDLDDVFPGSTIKRRPSSDYVANIFAQAGPWEITIFGAPRTKKTSNEIHLTVPKNRMTSWLNAARRSENPTRAILSRVKVQPNKRWREWAKHAPIAMRPELPIVTADGQAKVKSIEDDLHICATFYRERAMGDLLGFEQGLADFLQDRKIIVNDRQLVNWDGSRLAKDKERPRVELTLTRVEQGVSQEELKL
ncbi:MAG: hypothetical protein M8858_08185 [marine benthic group bacterium]|nr:hypothetical protein [Gemmatimonadota bacterium]